MIPQPIVEPLGLARHQRRDDGRRARLHAVLAPPRVGLGQPDRVHAGLVHHAGRLEHLLERLHGQLHDPDAERRRHVRASSSGRSAAVFGGRGRPFGIGVVPLRRSTGSRPRRRRSTSSSPGSRAGLPRRRLRGCRRLGGRLGPLVELGLRVRRRVGRRLAAHRRCPLASSPDGPPPRRRGAPAVCTCWSSAFSTCETCWLTIGWSTRCPIDADRPGDLHVCLPAHVRAPLDVVEVELRHHVHERADARAPSPAGARTPARAPRACRS